MLRRPPGSNRTDTLLPDTTLCRSAAELAALEAARRAASLRQPLVPFGNKDSVAEDSAHDVVELAFLVVQPVVLQDVADHLRLVQHQNLVETEAQLDGIAVIAGDVGEEAQRIDAQLRPMADQRAPAQDARLAPRRPVMGYGRERAARAD